MALLEEHGLNQVERPRDSLGYRGRDVFAWIFEILLKLERKIAKQTCVELQKLKGAGTLGFCDSK